MSWTIVDICSNHFLFGCKENDLVNQEGVSNVRTNRSVKLWRDKENKSKERLMEKKWIWKLYELLADYSYCVCIGVCVCVRMPVLCASPPPPTHSVSHCVSACMIVQLSTFVHLFCLLFLVFCVCGCMYVCVCVCVCVYFEKMSRIPQRHEQFIHSYK